MQEIAKKLESYFNDYKSKVLNELKNVYETYSKKENTQENLLNFNKFKDKIMSPSIGFLETGVRFYSTLQWVDSEKKENEENMAYGRIPKDSIRYSDGFTELVNFHNKHKLNNREKFSSLFQINFKKYSTEEIYVGMLDKGNRDGLATWTDGKEFYLGEWDYGKKSGYGTYIFVDGKIFSGEFMDDVPLVGMWYLNDKSKFYGKVVIDKKKNEILYMIGVKEGELEENSNTINYLYYKGEKTGIKNIDYNENFDIKYLKGVPEDPQKESVKWLSGISYYGYWENFSPILGEFIILNENLSQTRIAVYGNGTQLVPIKQMPFKNPKIIAESGEIKLDFVTGASYEGQISEAFELNGWGCLLGSDGNKKCGFFSKGRLYYEFDQDDKATMEFFKNHNGKFFEDSEQYMKEHPELKELPMLILKNKIKKLSTADKIGYQGHWENNDFKPGYIKFKEDNGDIVDCYVNDGSIITIVNKTFTQLVEKMKEVEKYKEDINELQFDLHFANGDKYNGNFVLRDSIINGYGCLQSKDGIVYDGLWNNNIFSFDKNLIKDTNFDIKKLKVGEHKVELTTGEIIEGKWSCYKFQSGKLIKKPGDEPIEVDYSSVSTHIDLTNGKKDFKFQPKIIYTMNMFINGAGGGRFDNKKGMLDIVYEHDESEELKILKNNNIITENLKFTWGVNYRNDSQFTDKETPPFEFYIKKKEEDKNIENMQNEEKKPPENEKTDECLTIGNINDLYIYNERNTPGNMTPNSDLKEYEKISYFNTQKIYSRLERCRIGNLKPVEREEINEKLEKLKVELNKELMEQNKQKTYVQISDSGMLKTHSDLFSFETFDNLNKYKVNRLIFDTQIRYSLFELNKLNGISEVDFNTIKFYNGDIYKFDNLERSYHHSMGSLLKYNFKNPKRFYWKTFFAESQFTKFDDEFYDNELVGILNWKCLTEFNVTKIKYNNGFGVTSYFSEGNICGNVIYENENLNLKREEMMFFNKSHYSNNSSCFFFIALDEMGLNADPLKYTFSHILLNGYRHLNFLHSQQNINQTFTGKEIIIKDNTHFDFEPAKDFRISIDKEIKSQFMSMIELCDKVGFNSTDITFGQNPLVIYSSNGDIISGKGSGRFRFNDEGKIQWSEGYTYEGDLFLSTPYGEGTYTNCLGVKKKGYFFRGHLLKNDYGLEKLKKLLIKKYSTSKDNKDMVSRLDMDDLRILTDPDVILGCQIMKDKIRFRRVFEEMESWKKEYANDMKCIYDGELDYDEDWSDSARNKIQIVLIKEFYEQKKKSIAKKKEKESLKDSNNIENLDEKMKKQKTNKDSEKSVGFKSDTKFHVPKRFKWIEKVDVTSLSDFEKQEAIEMVKDQNIEGFNLLYKKYLKKNSVFKLLNLKDQKKRNLLMLSGYYGHRQVAIDILTALKRCIKSEKLNKQQVQKFLETKDYEGNNLIDLIVIRGYNVKDEDIIANKEPEEFWYEDILKAEGDEGECKMPKTVEGNDVFNYTIKMIMDDERELFKSKFLTFTRLTETLQKGQRNGRSRYSTEDVMFVSKRAVILYILFKFCEKIKGLNLLKQKDYDEKRNNPLHFMLFKGDLHSVLLLLQHKIMMLLWRNGEKELPPQVIRWAGDNYFKARAVFASILREFTRNFNLRIIDNLLVQGEGVLNLQKKKLEYTLREKSDPKKEKQKVDIIKTIIEGSYIFKKEKVFLYSNNYILLSDELCKQYLQLIRDKSRYRHLKKEHKVLKNYTFIVNSELEALQKNFLDYYQGTFIGYHPPDVERFFRETVQEILTWYVFIYGDAEINPRIYTLLDIKPFDRILDGRNIFHFMCENNSYSLMKDFLDYLYEKCHDRPFDETRENYEKWDKETLNKNKLEELRRNLMIKTKVNRQTPAHLCVINKNFECLELLVEYDVDLEAINLRGRSVKELFDSYYPYNLEAKSSVSAEEISTKLINFLKQDIISSCKQHSLKFKYIKKNRNESYKDMMEKSKFQLNKELTEIRDQLFEDTLASSKIYLNSGKNILFYAFYLVQASELKEREDEARNMRACKENIDMLEDKQDHRSMMMPSDFMKDSVKVMALSMIKMILGGHTSFINSRQILMHIFNYKSLARIKNFKLTNYEKILKKELYKKLRNLDLSKPLSRNLMKDFTMDQHFCIEVRLKKGELIQDNVVLDQIDNIQKKYAEYGGGIRIDLIKGYKVDVKKSIVWYKPWTYFTCCRKYKAQTWFILIKVTDDLLNYIATREQMDTYNFLYNYHTLFYKDAINSDELEPLRHYQKIEIVMRLLEEEFEIKRYQKKGLVVKYFPIHDYSKMNLIKNIWSESKWDIHFKDIFNTKTKKNSLTVLSMITFYHGIQQGFYFGFLSLYNNSLFLLAIIGIIGLVLQYILGLKEEQLILGMSLIVGVWSTFFINLWKRREKELAYSFDAFEEQNIKEVRQNYKGEAVIDPGILDISKKDRKHNFRKLIFTSTLLAVGLTLTFLIYLFVTNLNNSILENDKLPELYKTGFTLAVGVLNGTLNFILSIIYGYCVDILVIWENHMYEEDFRKSTILKQQAFKLTSSVFTLVVQSIFQSSEDFDYNNYTLQILSNLVTSAILNYGLSLGLPFFTYLTSRFYYYSFILLCKWCCCKERRGKLDESREKIIYKILSSEETKYSFLRYCVEGGKITKEVQEKIDEYLKKTNQVRKKNPNKQNQVRQAKEIKNNSEAENLIIPPPSAEINHKEEFEKVFQEIENVKPHKSYKGSCKDLGKNRKMNISLRLKEEFLKYVLGREKIIESSYMLDLGSLEGDFYSSLLSQFTFVCLFSQFLISAGLVSYLINLFIIYMTIRAYTEITRRPISRRVSGIGVWSNLFNIIGYLGIVYNAVITVKLNGGFRNFLGDDVIKSELKDVEYVYRVQFGLLVFKFIVSVIVPTLPSWIETRINREKLTKDRVNKKLSSTLSRLSKEMKKNIDDNIFEDEESKNLKYFFKNEDEITEFIPLPKSYVDENLDQDEQSMIIGRDGKLFRIKKSNQDLL